VTIASGAASAGDSFLIDLVGSGASTFSVALTDPEKIAAALPVRSSETLTNRGDGALTDMKVTSTSIAPTLPLANELILTFNTAQNRYDVTGGATTQLAYNPANDASGVSRTIGGLTFTLSGAPVDDDVIKISNNTSASGDNRNMLLMGGLATSKYVEGERTFSDEYSSLVTNVAVKSRKAQSAANAEKVLLTQATTARDNLQGVNLEEEAIQLMRYQQALQAAAQLVSIADTVFQAMLTATQR
jgi:flagellar hook-associated protein 1 FlgK